MSRGWWTRFLLLLFFVILSVVYVYPTLANLNLEKTSFPFKQKVNLGLDLQGGLYMVMGVDFKKVYQDIIERQASSLQQALKSQNIPFTSVEAVTKGMPPEDPRIALKFPPAQKNRIHDYIKEQFWTLRLSGEGEGFYQLGLSRDFRTEVKERTVNQSIEVIRNRIDEFGVAEPSIVSQGEDRVVVELPGVKDIERAKDLIGKTAKLEFQIVSQKMSEAELTALIDEIEKKHNLAYKEGEKFSDYVARLNELAKDRLPAGTEIAFERVEGQTGEIIARRPYLLESKVDVTGEDMQDAVVGFHPETREPVVNFEMSPAGAQAFGRLTEENRGRMLAIVLDNIVHSAPVINSRIDTNGQITLGSAPQDQLLREAKDLAIVLRAGALPAQLDFLEQRVVGPSLGQDSIRKGAMAAAIGALVVFLFMVFYYRASGVIASMALLLNVLFILSVLVGLEATLTLPGIAGITLTAGMAVDANVIIFERIREELRAGKRIHGAIEAGFQKAWSAILDGNVTTAAAGVVLLIYGTGPIKGFAVTLLIGIATTMFTAVFASKVLFDLYLRSLERRQAKTLSI